MYTTVHVSETSIGCYSIVQLAIVALEVLDIPTNPITHNTDLSSDGALHKTFIRKNNNGMEVCLME